MLRVGGPEGVGGWLGDGVQAPLLSGSPSQVLTKCHPSYRAWLACAHSLPSKSLHDCVASFPATRAMLENCPQVKRDFFPADIAPADRRLIFPFQNECCSFHFLNLKKKKNNPNHKLKNRWGRFRIWLEFVWELIRRSQLSGNTAASRWGEVPGVSGAPSLPPKEIAGHEQAQGSVRPFSF